MEAFRTFVSICNTERKIVRNRLVGFYIVEFEQHGEDRAKSDDNPPIGLLLCTDYGETTVRYATEGLSRNLFVTKYQLQLPTEEEIRSSLLENISEEDFKEYKEGQ